MASLGCGSYEAFVIPRGGAGGQLVGTVEWSTLTWERVLDDTSQATTALDLANPACCDLMAIARPWQHELAVYRDGAPIWTGPLYVTTEPVEKNQLTARDLTVWWDRRRIHVDHVFREVDIATIFQAIADDAMAPDPSPGLFVSATPCGILSTQTYLAAQHLLAGPTIRDLSNIGIDWTAVNREVLVGGTTVPADPIGTLVDEHFQTPPQPTIDGSTQRNSIIVRGSGGGAAGDTVFGGPAEAAAAILRDGLLEDVVTVSTIQDNATAAAAAATRVELQNDVVLVDGCVLAANAPVTVDQLIAGAVVTLKLSDTCIPVDGDYRIQKVSGTISSTDGIEQITLSLQPVGTQ